MLVIQHRVCPAELSRRGAFVQEGDLGNFQILSEEVVEIEENGKTIRV